MKWYTYMSAAQNDCSCDSDSELESSRATLRRPVIQQTCSLSNIQLAYPISLPILYCQSLIHIYYKKINEILTAVHHTVSLTDPRGRGNPAIAPFCGFRGLPPKVAQSQRAWKIHGVSRFFAREYMHYTHSASVANGNIYQVKDVPPKFCNNITRFEKSQNFRSLLGI